MGKPLHESHNPDVDQETLNEQYAEMVLERVLLEIRRKNVLKEIDCSLQSRNKEDFYRLTEELKDLNKKLA